MAESSWPLPNADPDLDRAVNDIQYERLFAAAAPSGLVGLPTDPPLVYADGTGLQVKFRPNRGVLVRGHPWWTDGDGLTKPVTPNAAGSTRTDLVVWRLTRASWSVTAQVRAGIPGSPAPAATQQGDETGAGAGVWELAGAEVTVRSGASTILAEDIKPVGYYIGDPVLASTATAAPPHRPGRIRYEQDTGAVYVSNGERWLPVLEDATPAAAVPAGPGYSSTAPGAFIRVRRRNGVAYLQFNVQRSGGTLNNATTTLFLLPDGYRPPANVFFTGHSTSGGHCRIRVLTDGTVAAGEYGTMPTGGFFVGAFDYPL